MVRDGGWAARFVDEQEGESSLFKSASRLIDADAEKLTMGCP